MPLLTTLAFATSAVGTAAYAAGRRLRQRSSFVATSDETEMSQASGQAIVSPASEEDELNHYFAVSSVSLGLTMGGFLFQPLMFASVPLNIYTTLPQLRRALKSWRSEKRISSQTLEMTLVLGALATEHIFSAAVIDWAYYFGRKFSHQLQADLGSVLEKATKLQARNVWIEYENSEVQLPLNRVEQGDILIMQKNDIIPLAGHVVKGEGTLSLFLITRATEPVEVSQGSVVPPYAIVTSGRIHIQVTG